MEKKNVKVKNTTDKPKVEILLTKGAHVFSKNLDINILCGNNIQEYKQYISEYISHEHERPCNDDEYWMFNDLFVVFTDGETGNHLIESIHSLDTFLLQGFELIGMPYKDFYDIFKWEPENIEEKFYTAGSKKNWRYYTIYYYDKKGIQLWVWRNRIRDVIIIDPRSLED